MPNVDLSSPQPWLESLRRSRARRVAANRARRRRWSGRSAIGAVLASLTIATGGALAAGGGHASHHHHWRAGSAIAAAQRALGIPADGVAGPQTRRAVRRFQRAHGLIVDGIIGPQTLAALGISGSRTYSSSSRSSSGGSRSAPSSELAKIAQCESGGDPTAVSPSGVYRGKYQFSRATWRAMGGHGDPAAAPESVQDAMAAKLLATQGPSAWPNCA